MENTIAGKQNTAYQPLGVPEELSVLIDMQGQLSLKNVLIGVVLCGSPIFIFFILIDFQFNEHKTLVFISILTYLIIFDFLVPSTPKKVSKYVKNFLAERSVQSIDFAAIWDDSLRAQISRQINDICIKHVGWKKNSIFLPEDSFALMIELYIGDGSDVECIMAIEKYFAFKFPDTFFHEEKNGALKFKEVVSFVLSNSPRTILP